MDRRPVSSAVHPGKRGDIIKVLMGVNLREFTGAWVAFSLHPQKERMVTEHGKVGIQTPMLLHLHQELYQCASHSNLMAYWQICPLYNPRSAALLISFCQSFAGSLLMAYKILQETFIFFLVLNDKVGVEGSVPRGCILGFHFIPAAPLT